MLDICSHEEVGQEAPRRPVEAGRGSPTPEGVFHAYGMRVYNVALRLLGNEADAEDAAQEALLLVVRKLGTFRGECELTTWLHRVTVNAALRLRQRRARWPQSGLEADLDDLGGVPARDRLSGQTRQHPALQQLRHRAAGGAQRTGSGAGLGEPGGAVDRGGQPRTGDRCGDRCAAILFRDLERPAAAKPSGRHAERLAALPRIVEFSSSEPASYFA